MSYFAKPKFIIYDEWFDEDFEKTKPDIQNKKIKEILNIHEFFYEQSNHKIGASENNLQLDSKVNEIEQINNNYFDNNSEIYNSISHEKFKFFKEYTKIKIKFKFYPPKILIYSLSTITFFFIFGFFIFYIFSSKKSESNISNRYLSLEKEFKFSRRDH